MLYDLLAPVLTIVVGYLVRAALRALQVEINEATFNSLVAAIVVYLLALIGVGAAENAGLLG